MHRLEVGKGKFIIWSRKGKCIVWRKEGKMHHLESSNISLYMLSFFVALEELASTRAAGTF